MDYQIIEELFKIILTITLSSCIGLERELRQKGAGLRTHILVGVGSALLTLTSGFVYQKYSSQTVMDPTRLITGIVTGIGFLCAGTIIRSGDSVRGLTTAATLWIVSGVGIAVGCGHYSGALLVTFTVIAVLIGVRYLEHIINNLVKNKS
ncbi:MAG: MgtC/SapB family protein [Candidatus Omnitrophota bacterium]